MSTTPTYSFRGTPPPAGLSSPPTHAQLLAGGLTAAAGLSQFIEHGTSFVPAPAIQNASYTGASAGGAPGADFGPPGVGSAPVSLFGGLSNLELAIGALAIAGVLYAVTR